MPTELGQAYNPSWTAYPPGMSSEDCYIYYLWRKKYMGKPEKLYFNVRVGRGRPCPPEHPENIREMWRRQTQKRIDMIAVYPNIVHIVEFRHLANPNAVGRLLCYEMCYLEDPVLGLNYKLVLCTDHEDYDVAMLCEKFGILYLIV